MKRQKAIGIRTDSMEKTEIEEDAKVFGLETSSYLRFLHRIVGHPIADQFRKSNADGRSAFWNMKALENLAKAGVVREDFITELKKRGGLARAGKRGTDRV